MFELLTEPSAEARTKHCEKSHAIKSLSVLWEERTAVCSAYKYGRICQYLDPCIP